MTIEFSLRRRAAKARWLAILWLFITAGLLLGTFISLPRMAADLLAAVNKIDGPAPKSDPGVKDASQEPKKIVVSNHVFTLITLGLGISAVGFACYVLSRCALIEVDTAARLNGLADALCIGSADMKAFEKAATVMVPKTALGDQSMFSASDLKLMAEMLKQLKELK